MCGLEMEENHNESKKENPEVKQSPQEKVEYIMDKLFLNRERKQCDMTQLEYIVQAIKNLGGKATYSQLYEEYEKISGIILTPGKKAGIRKNIEDHSSDSMNYKGKEDLFYSVDGIGNGTWGLRK